MRGDDEMQDPNWWRQFIIAVPRPIPQGYMMGMQDEVRDGKHYVVEFLEPVPEYQPNPFTKRKQVTQMAQTTAYDEDDGDILISWSREEGFTVLNGKSI